MSFAREGCEGTGGPWPFTHVQTFPSPFSLRSLMSFVENEHEFQVIIIRFGLGPDGSNHNIGLKPAPV